MGSRLGASRLGAAAAAAAADRLGNPSAAELTRDLGKQAHARAKQRGEGVESQAFHLPPPRCALLGRPLRLLFGRWVDGEAALAGGQPFLFIISGSGQQRRLQLRRVVAAGLQREG